MKYQSTNLNRNIYNFLRRLDDWSNNPWRRYSLILIIFLSAFSLGSSIGMINGTLALMDPIGAFFTVALVEVFIRFRRIVNNKKETVSLLSFVDSFRIGFVYGLFMEGFKLF